MNVSSKAGDCEDGLCIELPGAEFAERLVVDRLHTFQEVFNGARLCQIVIGAAIRNSALAVGVTGISATVCLANCMHAFAQRRVIEVFEMDLGDVVIKRHLSFMIRSRLPSRR